MTTQAHLQQEEILKTAPASVKGLLARVLAGKASKRDAIKAHCLVCVGYQRAEVTACEVFRCPLWAYRPYQPK